tara:strand:- start:118 stop:996 length:879 start_codon:yes stop_codon:yes gene_type:complete
MTQVLQNHSYKVKTEKRSNLSVDLVYVTPEVAKNYLSYNTKNRKESSRNVKFLSEQMTKGLFLENGESIVFDNDNNLTDGQHRLMAIIKSGKSYHIPIVRGVKSNAMATYDTGKNRSSADVLGLNGYKNSSILSSLVKAIYKYEVKLSKCSSTNGYNRTETLTNQQILDFSKENNDWMQEIIKNISSIYKRSTVKFLGVSSLSFITYTIGGKNPNKDVYDFIKNICGLSRTEQTATSYIFNKLYNSKINKEPLNFYWTLGMCVKAWNYYIDGNPSVKYFKFSVDQSLPKINK